MGRPKGSKNKPKNVNPEYVEPTITTDNPEIKEPAETIINGEVQLPSVEDSKEKFNNIKENFENQQFEQTEKKQKKRSTYKTKKIKEEEFKQSISGIGSFLIGTIIKRLPNPMPLSFEEQQTFDTLFSKVAYKYSTYLGEYQEEFALAGITLMIIVPRLQKIDNNKENVKTDEKGN